MEELYKKIKEIYPEDTILGNDEISIVENWLNIRKDGYYYILRSGCNNCHVNDFNILLETEDKNRIIEILEIIER